MRSRNRPPRDGRDGLDGRDGIDGRNGKDGGPGLKGLDGLPGLAGVDGKDGRDGIVGKDGAQGLQGVAGRNGKDGAQGKAGLNGKDGLRGPRGEEGPTGPMPDHEWNGTRLRFENSDGSWGQWVELRGPPGQSAGAASGLAQFIAQLQALQTLTLSIVQQVWVADGDFVQMTDTNQNGVLRIQSADSNGSPVDNISLSVPTDAKSRDAQIRRIVFETDIGAITWIGPEVLNPPTSAARGDTCTLERIESGLWVRMY